MTDQTVSVSSEVADLLRAGANVIPIDAMPCPLDTPERLLARPVPVRVQACLRRHHLQMTGSWRLGVSDWFDRHDPRRITTGITMAVLVVAGVLAVGGVSQGERPTLTLDTTTTSSSTTTTSSTVPALVVEIPLTPPTRGTAAQVTDTLPPPPTIPTGLNGLPFAPEHLTGCDRMEWYANQAGLPDDFGWIGWAESRCLNDASSWCCHGYFQIHQDWIRWAPAAAAGCGVVHKDDFDAQTPIARQRNACMARVVFEAQGVCAWDVVRWC